MSLSRNASKLTSSNTIYNYIYLKPDEFIVLLFHFQFFDELIDGKSSGVKITELADKPVNKKIKFSDSESSSDDDNEEEGGEDENKEVPEEESKSKPSNEQNDPCNENETTDTPDNQGDTVVSENEKSNDNEKDIKCLEVKVEEPPNKKQCIQADVSKSIIKEKKKSIDQLIEAELEELADKSKVSDKISILRLLLFLIIIILCYY